MRDGKMHGRGKMTWRSGQVYEGEWKDDTRNGCRGKMIYASGNVYEGEWNNDKRNGEGTKTYLDGRQESGRWIDDKFMG